MMQFSRIQFNIEKAESNAELPDQERALWLEFISSRDASVRLQLIELNLPFARVLAAKWYNQRQGVDAPFEDYLHNAVLGLIQAIDRFDPNLGPHFRAFAQHRIEGFILNELSKLSEQHAQINLLNRLRKERIESLTENQHKKNQKSKNKGTLFEEMIDLAIGLSIGYMLEDYGMFTDTEKIDECDGYSAHALKELSGILQKLVELLPEHEKLVIKQHYFFGLGVEEIGEQLKLTKGRVSQLHKKALKQLKEMADTIGINLNL